MATNKFYQVKKEINKKEYIAQFNGISAAIRAADSSTVDGNINIEKFAKYLFEHVIVEPKGLTIDDFDTLTEFNDVVAFARGVMQGDFRDQADTGAAESKGKK